MSSLSGPFGPGRCPRLGENNRRYFRFLSKLWRRRKVEGFRTMAERRRRAGRRKRVHQATMIRSAGRQVGRTLTAALEDSQLMLLEADVGNHATEPSRAR